MKKQHLLVLAVALVVLAGLRFLLDRGPRTAGSLEDAGLGLVLGEDFEAESVAWMRLSGPEDGDGEPAVWEVERGPEGWVVTSAWGAPADAERMRALLDRLDGLRGEVRGEGAGLEPDFGVDEPSAARLELGSEPGTAAAVLRLGKAGDSPEAHFVLREGDERIRHVARGLTAELGLTGSSREPDPQHAVQLQLWDEPASELTEIAADRPDVNWQLLREPEAPPAETGAPVPAPEVEPGGWRVVDPQLPWPLRDGAADGLAGRVARVRATRVLDPATEGCSREDMTLQLRVATAGRDRVLRLGEETLDGDLVAARLDGGEACYGLSRWTAESLLPRASRLADVPQPLGAEPPAAEEFTRVDLERDGVSIRLERDGEDWRLSRPERAPADSARVGRLVSALRFLRWEDVALETVALPEHLQEHAVLTARAGESRWTLRILGERPGGFGGARYARIEGGEGPGGGLVGVLAGTSLESLLPSVEDLKPEPEPDDAG